MKKFFANWAYRLSRCLDVYFALFAFTSGVISICFLHFGVTAENAMRSIMWAQGGGILAAVGFSAGWAIADPMELRKPTDAA